jgi:hypothetical protein
MLSSRGVSRTQADLGESPAFAAASGLAACLDEYYDVNARGWWPWELRGAGDTIMGTNANYNKHSECANMEECARVNSSFPCQSVVGLGTRQQRGH